MKKIMFFILAFISVCGYCQKTKNGVSKVLLLDLKGKEFVFSDSIISPSIILYYTEPNCHACIDEIITLLEQKEIRNFYVIVQDRNDAIYRKHVIKRFTTLTSSIKAIYFDNSNQNYPFQNALSQIKKSPWLLFYNSKFEVFNNNEIFNPKNTELEFTKKFLKKITEFESLVNKM